MDKLKLHSPDITEQNIAKLTELFPNCVTETRTDNGEVKQAIDFDQLRQELSGSIVEGPQERYQLNWPGKREALLTANAPIAKTLRPYREESVDFDTTRNLFIEGDNLDALKLLQETYLNRVQMIYIDPPYNTGNDFIYEDDFSENSEKFLKRSNQKDEEDNRLLANTESNGRFHSDWLSMMYSRLKLCRNLLRDDGSIFISIGEDEISNLRKICDEVFGNANFVATAIWQKADSPRNSAKQFSEDHDFILIYGKSPEWIPKRLPRTDEANAIYSNPDNDPRGAWLPGDPYANKPYSKGLFTTKGPTGREFSPPPGRYWRISEEKLHELDGDNRIWWGPKGSARPSIKRYLSEVSDLVPRTLWKKEDVGSNRTSKNEIRSIFPNSESFDTPKPTKLVERMLRLSTRRDDDIILDFFAGSATTAHAVMQLNAEDGSNRQFIMVQLPEPYTQKSDNHDTNFSTIAEISKERIRRAGKKILEDDCHKKWKKDVGFRVLKIDTSNMNDVYYTPDAINQDDLFNQADNIRQDRTPEDLLFQVMLDWGVDLTLPIVRETIAGKAVFHVDENALAACFDEGINEAFVKDLATRQPLRAVFRDSGFANDSVKINIEQIFKHLSPHTDIKVI